MSTELTQARRIVQMLNPPSALRLARRLADHVPTYQDGMLGTAVKLIALAGITRDHFLPERSPINEFVHREGLTEKYAPLLSRLVFQSELARSFTTRIINLDGESKLVERQWQGGGSLFFQLFDHGPSTWLWHREGFDFRGVFRELWTLHNGRITIRTTLTGPEFSGFPETRGKLFGDACRKLADLIERQQRYSTDRLDRTYLFTGEPGTGKTTVALEMARTLGHRVLRIETDSLMSLGSDEIGLVLQNLVPDFLVVDDVDKINFETGRFASLLATMEWIKATAPGVVVIFTANEADKLGKTLMRPDRIDEVHEFKPPGLADRRLIIKGYAQPRAGRELSQAEVDTIAKRTAGLTPAWLKEVVTQCRYDEPRTAVARVLTVARLAGVAKKSSRGKSKKDDDDDKPEKEKR